MEKCHEYYENSVAERSGFEISLVRLSEMSKNDSLTSRIPAGLVQRMTAYFWFSHKCIGVIHFRQVNGRFWQVIFTIHLPEGQVHSIWNFETWRYSEKLWFWIFTRGQFWPSGIVVASVCVCMCVCLCVRQSWACPSDNSSTVQARITKFGPEM